MLHKTSENHAEQFHAFVRDWFVLISKGEWNSAFAMIDIPPNDQAPYSPEVFRREIEQVHFCEGAVFRERFPEGVRYCDPRSIGEPQRCELYEWSPGVFQFEYDVPLNGERSDLTSGWEFLDAGAVFRVRLDWLHVL